MTYQKRKARNALEEKQKQRRKRFLKMTDELISCLNQIKLCAMKDM